jgi:hypothetical protein
MMSGELQTTEHRSPAEGNGRGKGGLFAPGNKFGKGNPHAAKVQKLRSTLVNAVTQKDIREVVKKLVEKAKEGCHHSAKILFDRIFGAPIVLDVEDRLAEVESRIEEMSDEELLVIARQAKRGRK